MSEVPHHHIDLSVKPGLEILCRKNRDKDQALRVRFILRYKLESEGHSKSQIDTLLELRRLHHGRFK